MLISEVMMPGMSGVEMHDRVIALGYAPPTIFITAFPSANLKAKALANDGCTRKTGRSRHRRALAQRCPGRGISSRQEAGTALPISAALKTTSATAH
jgi:CheY-like chemotaxis protein